MRGGSGLRHGSISASLRPSPKVSARSGDDPRLDRCQVEQIDSSPRDRYGRAASSGRAVSPFVLMLNDSESLNADPPRTSLALSNRLAGDQQDRAIHPRWRQVRTLPASPWPPSRAACRRKRGLVGRRYQRLARRSRAPFASGARLRAARRNSHDAQTRLSGDRAPQSRSDVQRTALAQSCCIMPALPHDPRRAGASPAALVERLPQAGPRRPFLRTLQLSGITTSSTRAVLRLRDFEYLSIGAEASPALHQAPWLTMPPRTRSG